MLKRSSKRIQQTHEFFTPGWLVNKLNSLLPQSLFQDTQQRFVDECCGSGNILVRIVIRKINNGSTPTEALKTTFGVDLMEDNVRECRRRLINVTGDSKEHWKIVNNNIVCSDMFKWDYRRWKPLVDKKQELVDNLLEF